MSPAVEPDPERSPYHAVAPPAGPADLAARLASVAGAALGRPVAVANLEQLSAGASRETWTFDAVESETTAGQGGPQRHPLVLRRDPPGDAKGMAMEAALLRAGAGAGVPVPTVLAASDDPAVLGTPFLLMERIDGETLPRRILRDPAYAAARPRLARQCGEILARIHAIDPGTIPAPLEADDALERWWAVYDDMDEPRPAFELAFRHLRENRPPPGASGVVHGDFRNGNLVVGPEGVRAVLDWELAHIGDPLEDLAWLCVRAWRFGEPLPVGGFGTVDELLDGYASGGGVRVDRDALRWWELLGALKWGIMCMTMVRSHITGAVRSVERVAIGRRVCEQEWDVLEFLG